VDIFFLGSPARSPWEVSVKGLAYILALLPIFPGLALAENRPPIHACRPGAQCLCGFNVNCTCVGPMRVMTCMNDCYCGGRVAEGAFCGSEVRQEPGVSAVVCRRIRPKEQ
jgi:hypothetical protein